MTSAPPPIVPFESGAHDRSVFSCGADELDTYIRHQASQDAKRNLTRVFAAVADGEVVGFYTLSAASLACGELPSAQARKLPRYPVPVVLIGRLAVDRRWQGRELGAHLLIDALVRTALASESVGVHGIIVDARDDDAARFYRKYGFISLNAGRRLILPLATVRKMMAGAPLP